MKIFQVVLLAIVAVLFVAFFCFGQEVTVAPQETIISVSAGEEVSGEIVITNHTDKELKINIIVEDWANEANGQNLWGLSDWVIIEPSEMLIPVGGQASIIYLVVIPEGIKGPHWAGLRLMKVTETVDGDIVSRAVAVTSIKQADPNILVHGAFISGLGFLTTEDGSLFILQIEKTGTDFNLYSGSIKIQRILPTRIAEVIEVLDIPEVGILPFHLGEILEVPYNQELSPGVYQAIIEIQIGDGLKISGVLPILR